jgi:hypothetical protein
MWQMMPHFKKAKGKWTHPYLGAFTCAGNIQITTETFPVSRTILSLTLCGVEEVTACTVWLGKALKARGFPHFLLHVIIYFLKLNHALLMALNVIRNATPSIIISPKRAKNTPLTAALATAPHELVWKCWFSSIAGNGYPLTSACLT